MRWSVGIMFLFAACTGVRSDPALGEAECNAQDGPLHDYSTKAELDQLILGQWVHCTGPALMSSDQAGIEFLSDGTFYVLVSDGAGGLVRETGFDKQGTWIALQLTPTSVEFAWDNASHTGSEGSVAFEDEPRKFLLALEESSVYALFP